MELRNAFELDADRDTVWHALRDLEATARCFPGAEVTKVDDTHYTAVVRVRIGPVLASYAADVQLLEWDDAARRALMTADARETHGQGTASARVTLEVSGERPTAVAITSDLTISGRVAQVGGAAMQDVAGHLVEQFAANLQAELARPPDAAPAPAGDPPASAAPVNGLKLVALVCWRRVQRLWRRGAR